MSRETVRIALTYAALNDLEVNAADIMNAYLTSPTSETHYLVCGPEFGIHEGKIGLIKRALYGGKSAGRDFWLHLRDCMKHLGFMPCKADPDLWMRLAVKATGEAYWEYVLCYVDDILTISEPGKAESVAWEVGEFSHSRKTVLGRLITI